MTDEIFSPEFLTVFNHAKDIGWWDGPVRFHRVNRNIVANCYGKAILELLSVFFEGKMCFEIGGNGFKFEKEDRFIRGLDLLHQVEYGGVMGDIMCLPFKDDSIDLIVTRHVMEHLEDMHLGFKEVARVMKHGGMIWGTIPDKKYFLHSTDPSLGRGVCAPSEKTPEELLEVLKSIKELNILLFNTHDNNFEINFILRVNKL